MLDPRFSRAALLNPTIEHLLELVESDALPAGFTSSHWRHFGALTDVRRDATGLHLKGEGFDRIERLSWFGKLLHRLERVTYRSTVSKLHHFSAVWVMAKRLASDLSCGLTYNVFKSAAILAVLVDHWQEQRLTPRTFALIGDGSGYLGALIRRWNPRARLYCIDLPKMLVFQANTHVLSDSEVRMNMLVVSTPLSVTEDAQVTFVPPDAVESISTEVDCAINVASMQEMNEQSIRTYFQFLRRRSHAMSRFYCVNRKHKVLLGGEVAAFSEYPWRSDDQIFIDGPCPYYTHFFDSTTLPRGPRFMGLRIPFINYFDGDICHRLVRLGRSP